MLNVGTIQTELHDDGIKRVENYVPAALSLFFLVVGKRRWTDFAFFAQINGPLEAVFWDQNLESILANEKNVTGFVLDFFSEKQL